MYWFPSLRLHSHSPHKLTIICGWNRSATWVQQLLDRNQSTLYRLIWQSNPHTDITVEIFPIKPLKLVYSYHFYGVFIWETEYSFYYMLIIILNQLFKDCWRGGHRKLSKKSISWQFSYIKIVKTYWHDHILESSWGAFSDGNIRFSIHPFSGEEMHFLNFSKKTCP
jgi:hypothetical protein